MALTTSSREKQEFIVGKDDRRGAHERYAECHGIGCMYAVPRVHVHVCVGVDVCGCVCLCVCVHACLCLTVTVAIQMGRTV